MMGEVEPNKLPCGGDNILRDAVVCNGRVQSRGSYTVLGNEQVTRNVSRHLRFDSTSREVTEQIFLTSGHTSSKYYFSKKCTEQFLMLNLVYF